MPKGNHKLICIGSGQRVTTHKEQRTEPADPEVYKGGVRTIWESVKDGREAFQFEATVDLTYIDHMGYLAAINKTGICRRGRLLVKIINRKKLPL